MKKILILILATCSMSCGQEFLDVKPNSSMVVPSTLDDFEQLLANPTFANTYPDVLDVMSDDVNFEESYWNSINNRISKNSYIWADDIFESTESDVVNWERNYMQIFYTNVVLEGVAMIDENIKNSKQHKQVQVTAYFLRAWALYNLAQLYAPAYKESSASKDLAVPVPLLSDVNEKVYRNFVSEIYDRILSDLNLAIPLASEGANFAIPTRSAVYALKARVLLNMGRYDEALEMSRKSIEFYDSLVDLNTSSLDYKKAIYMAYEPANSAINPDNPNVLLDEQLYLSYKSNDLRKSFFKLNNKEDPYLKDIYGMNGLFFRGLDSDEQYLIKAECEARLGNKDEAMATLNHLLKYVHTNYVDQEAATKEVALGIILQERRKQLVFRGLRWSDLKRYNRDGANIDLTRKFGNTTYTLKPGSPKWLFPIPSNEIKISGLTQNPR